MIYKDMSHPQKLLGSFEKLPKKVSEIGYSFCSDAETRDKGRGGVDFATEKKNRSTVYKNLNNSKNLQNKIERLNGF